MAIKELSGVVLDDKPEPGFVITFREWNVYVGRIKRLADPVEHAHGWMQTSMGVALGTLYGLVTFPGVAHHVVRLTLLLTGFLTFAILTLFFLWFSSKERERRPETAEGICADMTEHRDAKALEAASGPLTLSGLAELIASDEPK